MNLSFVVRAVGLLAVLPVLSAGAVTSVSDISQRALDDAKVIRRVAEVAGKDLPRDLLQKIVSEDIEVLRGLRTDGTYDYAHYEPIESARTTEGFKAGPVNLSNASIKGDFVYQLVIDVPSRRYVVRRNLAVFIEKIEIDRTPFDERPVIETIDVQSWIEPGRSRAFELNGVMRRARATVYAKTADGVKTASLEISLVQGSVIDNRDSPFLLVVREALRIQQLLRKGDAAAIESAASSMIRSVDVPVVPVRTVETTPSERPSWERRAEPREPAPAAEPLSRSTDAQLYEELLAIEDLLAGDESEQIDGLRRLHQLVRRTRPDGMP